MAPSAAAPAFTVNEWIMIPAVVVKATDDGNIVLSIFDQIVLLTKADLRNFAMSLGVATGAGASVDRRGIALTAPQSGAFMDTSFLDAQRGSVRGAWDAWMKQKGFRTA